MSLEWEIVEAKTVQSGRKIPLPDNIVDEVVFFDAVDKPSVQWSYEENGGYIVISNQELSKTQYKDAGSTQVYNEDSGLKIRPSTKKMPERIQIKLRPGVQVFYLAHKEMLTGEIRSAYLLTKTQMKEALATEAEDTESLKNRLLNTPGFLS